MRMFRLAPVQLPACICTQLIVAAVQCVAQGKVTVCLSPLQLQQLTLYQVAVLVQQFHIQYFADFTGKAVASAHVRFIE